MLISLVPLLSFSFFPFSFLYIFALIGTAWRLSGHLQLFLCPPVCLSPLAFV